MRDLTASRRFITYACWAWLVPVVAAAMAAPTVADVKTDFTSLKAGNTVKSEEERHTFKVIAGEHDSIKDKIERVVVFNLSKGRIAHDFPDPKTDTFTIEKLKKWAVHVTDRFLVAADITLKKGKPDEKKETISVTCQFVPAREDASLKAEKPREMAGHQGRTTRSKDYKFEKTDRAITPTVVTATFTQGTTAGMITYGCLIRLDDNSVYNIKFQQLGPTGFLVGYRLSSQNATYLLHLENDLGDARDIFFVPSELP
jgi:hypothetical protein